MPAPRPCTRHTSEETQDLAEGSLWPEASSFRFFRVVVIFVLVVVLRGEGFRLPTRRLSLGVPEALAAGPSRVADLTRAAERLEVLVRPQLVRFLQVFWVAEA